MHTLVDIAQSDATRSSLAEQRNYINYLKAVADHAAAEAAIIEAQKAFAEYNNKVAADLNARATQDADVIK